jgi:hypothetical protein
MLSPTVISIRREPWNKGKLVGQKAPLKLKDIWAIRVRLEMFDRKRELALFNLAIDSKLRGCDLVQLRVRDVAHGERIVARAIVMQQKTQRPVQFGMRPSRARTFCSQVGCDSLPIYRHGNTRESSKPGSPKSDWTPAPMGPTRCAARRHR